MEKTRPILEVCMMKTAMIFSERSTCDRLHVGAVITNEEMTNIDAIGYNGGARGLSNACESTEPGKCGHIHAEINAIIKSNYNIPNKRIFITHSMCSACAKAIINARISRVYFRVQYRDKEPIKMLQKAGVEVYCVDTERNWVDKMGLML